MSGSERSCLYCEEDETCCFSGEDCEGKCDFYIDAVGGVTMKGEKCPECNGLGYIDVGAESWAGGPTCLMCAGTGRVKMEE